MPAFRVFVVLSILLGIASPAWALGMEDFGSEPLAAANFDDWPGVIKLVNHKSRVYHSWVNGNEHCYYKGGPAELNECLKLLASVQSDVLEVVLRPAPGQTQSFHGMAVEFDWNLHVVGGIARHLSTRDKGSMIWPTHPVLSIYVSDELPLEKIEIPPGLMVLGLADLKTHCVNALESTEITVRGWGTGILASLDRFDEKSLAIVVKMLGDQDDWVKVNAVGALEQFGARAKKHVELLRQLDERTKDANLRQAIARAIPSIEAAKDDNEARELHAKRLAQIEAWLKARDQKNDAPPKADVAAPR